MDLMQSYSIDFAFLSETWLPDSSNCITSIIKTYGYDCYHSNRFGRCKGCAVVISKKWSNLCTNSTQYNYPSFDAVSLNLNDLKKTKLICIYRPPYYGSFFTTFLNEFHDFASHLLLNGSNFVLCGDYNVHWNISDESYTYRFQDLLDELGIQVKAPTVPTHSEGNTLDLILSDVSTSPQINLQSVETNLGISDHYPILFNINLVTHPPTLPTPKVVLRRNCKDVDLDQFNHDLDAAISDNLSSFDSSTSLHSALTKFSESVSGCLEQHAPLQSKVIKPHNAEKPPWIDGEYQLERAKRRRFEKIYKKTKTLNSWNNYLTQSVLCRKLIKFKRKKSYANTLDEIDGDQKALFKFVNKITDSKIDKQQKLPNNVSDPTVLANKFNTFFIEKINRIRQTFPTTSDSAPAGSYNHNLLADIPTPPAAPIGNEYLTMFSPCTVNELKDIIRQSGIKVSLHDILPGHLMNNSIDTLLPYLNKLVNLSIATGNFDGLKDAVVRPLYKNDADDINDLSNYRPISNLTFLSKLVERVVLSRLQQHMNSINYNCDTQFGYKKYHGTETLLLKVVNDILVGLDSKSGVVLILIDLSAAFDTVCHNKLINILANELKIQGTALKWFKSYLTGRTQRVVIGDTLSEPLELSFGVPQGSVLGPILFNIYVASLSNIFCDAGFQTLSYADDNAGYQAFSLSCADTVLNEYVPTLLHNISNWMQQYFLKLNEDKTKLIVFGSKFFKSNMSINSITTTNGEVISVVDKVKYLGAYLDDRLSMKHHINKITSQCYSNLRKIKSIRSFLTQQQCELLINATVTSRLDYSNALFFKLNWSDRLAKLSRVQSYASKIILKKGRRQGLPFPDRLNVLHWLSIEKRVTYKILLLVFKCLHQKAPPLLTTLISLNTSSRQSNSLSTRLFYPTSSFGDRAFCYYAPQLWNALPAFMRQVELLSGFKSKLKTYLFSNYDQLMQRFYMYRS